MKVYIIQRYEDDLLIFATKEAAQEFARNDEFMKYEAESWAERAYDLAKRFPDIPAYAEWAGRTKKQLAEDYLNLEHAREEEVIE